MKISEKCADFSFAVVGKEVMWLSPGHVTGDLGWSIFRLVDSRGSQVGGRRFTFAYIFWVIYLDCQTMGVVAMEDTHAGC